MREGLVVVVVVVVVVVNFIEREDFIVVVDPRDGESLSLLLPLSDGSSLVWRVPEVPMYAFRFQLLWRLGARGCKLPKDLKWLPEGTSDRSRPNHRLSFP